MSRLELEDALRRSHSMSGPLGAAAFVCLEALARGGADEREVETARSVFQRCFAALSDRECNVLADVLHARVSDRPASGAWYPGGVEGGSD